MKEITLTADWGPYKAGKVLEVFVPTVGPETNAAVDPLREAYLLDHDMAAAGRVTKAARTSKAGRQPAKMKGGTDG